MGQARVNMASDKSEKIKKEEERCQRQLEHV